MYSITVVLAAKWSWLQHTSKLFCSPENVGEQGVSLILLNLFQDRSKRMDHTSLSNVFDDLFMEPKHKEATTEHHKNLEQFTPNDLHPVKSINRVGGMGAFCSGELDPIYLAKMATERFETKGTKCWHHNWKFDPRIPTIPNRRLVNQLQLFGSKVILAANTRASSFVPLRTWGEQGVSLILLNLFQDRSKRMDIHPCQMCLMICSWNQNTKKQQQNTTRTLNSSHKWSPPRQVK